MKKKKILTIGMLIVLIGNQVPIVVAKDLLSVSSTETESADESTEEEAVVEEQPEIEVGAEIDSAVEGQTEMNLGTSDVTVEEVPEIASNVAVEEIPESDIEFRADELGSFDRTTGLVTGKIGTSEWVFQRYENYGVDVPEEELVEKGKLTFKAGGFTAGNRKPWAGASAVNPGVTPIVSLDIQEIELEEGVTLEGTTGTFFNAALSNLKYINGEGLRTFIRSNITDISSMFGGCINLELEEDALAEWDVSNVTNMGSVFNSLQSTEKLDLTSWDTRKVTNMWNTFIMAPPSSTMSASVLEVDVTGWDTSNVTNMAGMFNYYGGKSLNLSSFNTSKVTNMSQMFNDAGNISSLDLSNFDTSKVTNMSQMFRNNSKLTSLNIEKFTKSKDLVDVVDMFRAAPLTEITLGPNFYFRGTTEGFRNNSTTIKWEKKDGSLSSAVTNKEFIDNYGTGELTAGTYVVERSKWGTSPWSFDSTTGVLTIDEGTLAMYEDSPWNRTDGSGIKASEIKKIELIGDVKAPENAYYLFSSLTVGNRLTNVTSMSVENLDVSQVTDMYGMFDGCSSLLELNLSGFDTSKVTNMYAMFKNCSSMLELDVSSFDTSKVTSMHDMLSDTSKLEKLTLGASFKFVGTNAGLGVPASSYANTGKWQKDDRTSIGYTPADFIANYGTGDLKPGTYVAEELPLWGTSPYEFDEDGTLKVYAGTLDVSVASPWNRTDEYAVLASEIKKIELIGDVKAPADASRLFSSATIDNRLTNVESINVENLDTSQVTNMYEMFHSCGSVLELDVSSFDTSQVTNMHGMFQNCGSVLELDVSKWDTRKVTKMSYMFANCGSVLELDVSSFDTSQVTDMEYMFNGCSSVLELDVSSFDTSQVTSMRNMFASCGSVLELDVSSFDTSQVTTMSTMFNGCSSVLELDLSKWDTSQVTDMYYMFNNCSSVLKLDVSSFDTSQVTTMTNMFLNVSKLEKLTLGASFKFVGTDAGLGVPASGDKEKWTRKDNGSNAYSPEEFMEKYGKDDLLGGTYVGAEVVSLKLTDFDWETPLIGEEAKLIFSIKDEKLKEVSSDVDIKVDLAGMLPELVVLDVTVEYKDNESNSLETETVELPEGTTDFTLSQGIVEGGEITISVSGTAWNNTTPKSVNNVIEMRYRAYGTDYLQKDERYLPVGNGTLSLAKVPETLVFEDTTLQWDLLNRLIDRIEEDWSIVVSDYRGTNDTSAVPDSSARTNWDIVVTATPFTDEAGDSVDKDGLSVAFVSEEETNLLSDEGTLVVQNDVTDETPFDNHELTLKWGQEAGFKAFLPSPKGVEKGKTYTAEMTFDLRLAP